MQKAREESCEHFLMCLICRSSFDDYDHQPKFLPCHHTFCKECLCEYVQQLGDEIECPSCRTVSSIPVAGVSALQTNFYIKSIQNLVSGYSSGSNESTNVCLTHMKQPLSSHCVECGQSLCQICLTDALTSMEQTSNLSHKSINHPSNSPVTSDYSTTCSHKTTKSLTKAQDDSHQKLQSTFTRATNSIEKKKVNLNATLKQLSTDKDSALKKIDSCFEQHVHTLQRRATLLKNNVIAEFSDNVANIEKDMLEISTALTCVISVKEYHEAKLNQGDLKDFQKGIKEIEEVKDNITRKIQSSEIHINFDDSHGSDKFNTSVKDLGRVKCLQSVAQAADSTEHSMSGTMPTSAKHEAKILTIKSDSTPKQGHCEAQLSGPINQKSSSKTSDGKTESPRSKTPNSATKHDACSSDPNLLSLVNKSETSTNSIQVTRRKPVINPHIKQESKDTKSPPKTAPKTTKKNPGTSKSRPAMSKNVSTVQKTLRR